MNTSDCIPANDPRPADVTRSSFTPITGASIAPLRSKTIAVLGFGAQGRPHALNLRDSGLSVVVAQRPGGQRHADALAAGFSPLSIADAVPRADLIVFALPDETAPAIFETEIRPRLRPGQTLGFIHGYNIHYRQIVPPPGVAAVLVAPKAQGRAVRAEFMAGRGVAALIAVHQVWGGFETRQSDTGHTDGSSSADSSRVSSERPHGEHRLPAGATVDAPAGSRCSPSPGPRDIALAWAAGLGCHRAAIFETTFKDETETDLFGEQAVLCGGVTSLIKAAFDTLTDAGYPPELAYFECCHELKLLVDLIHEGGITYMRERISNTARYGDLTRGPRVIDGHVRAEMRKILAEIQSGQFAAEWAAEAAALHSANSAAERPRFTSLTDADRSIALEIVGQQLRDLIKRPTTP